MKHRVVHLSVVLLTSTPAMATTYYVSPTGSDSNAGTSATSPWSSVTRVDDTAFQPGDQVLFQYGAQWNGSLIASSSGTAAAPITYGAYGNATLGLPTFSGSDPVAAAAFSHLAGTADTFQATAAAPVNWVFDNHAFTHEAQDATGSSTPATDLAYVNATAGSFYYNPTSGSLYVNLGTASLAGHTITAATRADAILAQQQSNLVFKNLAVTETAQDNAGYGIRVQDADNVSLVNCTATSTGKHAFGVIDSTGFVGTGLTATGSAPDLGFGGVSAFVSYADTTRSATTSQWVNCTYNSPNGPYGVFVSHGSPGSIASIVIKNMVSLGGYGTGLGIQTTGPGEVATITGGHFDGGIVEVSTDHSTVSGVTITGPTGAIQVDGDHDTIAGNTIAGIVPNTWIGRNGGVIVNGTNATVSDNNFSVPNNYGPALGITADGGGGTSIHGNVFQSPISIALLYNDPSTALSSYGNTYADGTAFMTQTYSNTVYTGLQGWQAAGYDLNATTLLPQNTTLPGGGAATVGGVSNTPAGPFVGNASATNVPEPASLTVAAVVTVGLAGRRRRPATGC